MELQQIVSAIIIGLISILLLIYSFFTSKEKGPILSNSYLLATAEERKKMNKSAEYRLVTNVFSTLGMVFLLLAVSILTQWSWIYYIIGVLIIALMIYVIKESMKSEMGNQ